MHRSSCTNSSRYCRLDKLSDDKVISGVECRIAWAVYQFDNSSTLSHQSRERMQWKAEGTWRSFRVRRYRCTRKYLEAALVERARAVADALAADEVLRVVRVLLEALELLVRTQVRVPACTHAALRVGRASTEHGAGRAASGSALVVEREYVADGDQLLLRLLRVVHERAEVRVAVLRARANPPHHLNTLKPTYDNFSHILLSRMCDVPENVGIHRLRVEYCKF